MLFSIFVHPIVIRCGPSCGLRYSPPLPSCQLSLYHPFCTVPSNTNLTHTIKHQRDFSLDYLAANNIKSSHKIVTHKGMRAFRLVEIVMIHRVHPRVALLPHIIASPWTLIWATHCPSLPIKWTSTFLSDLIPLPPFLVNKLSLPFRNKLIHQLTNLPKYALRLL